MKTKSRIKRVLVICVLSQLLLSINAAAFDLSLQADTDRTKLVVGERLNLTIKVTADMSGSLPDPDLPEHTGFDIIGRPRQSSSFSWINGRVNSSRTITYTLVAREAGLFKIGSTKISYRGIDYSSDPVEVTVEYRDESERPDDEGEELPNISSDSFNNVMVSASLNMDMAYLGEPVVYTFSFFRKVRLWESPGYEPPDFKDFWVEDLPRSGAPKEVVVKGEKYIRQDIKKVLFSTKPGETLIESAKITIQTDPFAGPVTLFTKPLKLEVLRLPDEPSDFSGAVGNFTIEAEADRKRVKEGEPVSLKIKIAGVGNIKALPQPVYEDSDLFRGYEPKDSVEISTLNDMISGSKTFEYLFIPVKSGKLSLPEFSFTFFDPAAAEYKTVKTKKIDLTVQEDNGTSASFLDAEKSKDGDRYRVRKNLHPIRTKSDLANWRINSYAKGVYPWIFVLPPFILLVIIASKRRLKNRAKNEGNSTTLDEDLKTAEMLITGGKDKEFFSAAILIMNKCFLEGLQISGKNPTKDELILELEKAGYPGGIIEKAKKLFAGAEIGSYSPIRHGKVEMEAFFNEVKEMVKSFKKMPPPAPGNKKQT